MQSQRPRKLAAPDFLNRCASECRRLFFSALLTFPLISHPSVLHALPKSNPAITVEKAEKTPTVRKSPVRRQSVSCRFEKGVLEYKLPDGTVKKVEDLLERNEIVLDLNCHERYAFVLTSTSLISVPGKDGKSEDGGPIKINLLHVKKDIRDMHKTGLVSWAQAEDRCYFLTADSKITEIPVVIHGSTVPEYSIPYELRSAAMVFHSGFLFIAPAVKNDEKTDVMVVMRFVDKAKFRELALPSGMKDAEFFFRGNRLFFGKRGVELEVRIKGPKPSDVQLIKKSKK